MIAQLVGGRADTEHGWCWTCMAPTAAEGPVYTVIINASGAVRRPVGRWRSCAGCGVVASRPAR